MPDKKTDDFLYHLPLKPIKHILKCYYNGEISDDACFYVRDLLVLLTEFLAKEAVQEFKNSNMDRQNHGLSKLKRLNKESFVLVRDRFFKNIDDITTGKVGNHTQILLCQDGAEDG